MAWFECSVRWLTGCDAMSIKRDQSPHLTDTPSALVPFVWLDNHRHGSQCNRGAWTVPELAATSLFLSFPFSFPFCFCPLLPSVVLSHPHTPTHSHTHTHRDTSNLPA